MTDSDAVLHPDFQELMKSYTLVPKRPPKGWKEHYGTFVIGDDGAIWLPSDCTNRSSMEVFLYASYDNERVVTAGDGKHALYRSTWLKANFPQCRETVEFIEKRIPEYLKDVADDE